MFIVTEYPILTLTNTDNIVDISANGERLRLKMLSGDTRTLTNDGAKERLEDIVAALTDGDTNVYDVRQPVGYWQKAKTTTHARKKTTTKPAPAE